MDDLISRQALLDNFGFSEKTRKWGGDHSGYNTMMLYEIQDMIESAPSVNPQHSGDLISRAEAIKAIDEKAKRIKNEDTLNGLAGAVGILFDLPPVKPQEKTGQWVGIDEEPHEDYECDKCGYVVSTYTANIEPHTEYKFCPNCGAKMQEEEE